MVSNMDSLNKDILKLAVILFIGLLLRGVFFSGYVSGDDSAYIARAFQYSLGDFTPPYSHWGGRVLVVLSTAFSYSLFGVSDASTVIFPFLLSLGAILVTYGLGTELFDQKTGLLAAALIAFFPMEVLFASQLFPYAFLSFFTSLALLLFLKGRRQGQIKLLFLAGLMLGFAYLSRVTALYCGLFFLLLILWERKIDRSYFVVAAGFLVAFILEILWSYWQSGEPFYRYTHILMNRIDLPLGVSANLQEPVSTSFLSSRPVSWYFEPFLRPVFEQEFGGFFLLLWPVILYQLFWGKNRQVKLLLLWIIPIFLYVSYGSTSPVDYSPLRRLPRYYSIIVIPFIVLLAYQIMQWPNLKIRVLAVAALAGMSLLCLLLDNSPYVTEREKALTAYINSHGEQTFVVPRSLYFDYLYYSNFKPGEHVLHYYRDNDRSDTLKRIQIVAPEARRAKISDFCGEALVVDDQGYFRDEKFLFGEVKPLAQFDRTDRLYHQIIRNPLIFSALSFVRDPKRLELLASNSSADAYYIYPADKVCQ